MTNLTFVSTVTASIFNHCTNKYKLHICALYAHTLCSLVNKRIKTTVSLIATFILNAFLWTQPPLTGRHWQEMVSERTCVRNSSAVGLACPALVLSQMMISSSVLIFGGLSFTSRTCTVTGTWLWRLGLSENKRKHYSMC